MKRPKLVWTCPHCREVLPQYLRACPTCVSSRMVDAFRADLRKLADS